MPEPLQLPIRVLLKGASTMSWLSPMGGPRSDLNFARALEVELLGAGRPATVQTISVPSERVKTTLRRWEEEILGFSPDVIVLVYGHYETVHLFLPWWMERHANSLKFRPGFVRETYRKRVVRPVWMFLAKLQARADKSAIGSFTRTWRASRSVRDLEQLIVQVQAVGSPMVLVFELMPPAKRYQSWFPGMAARIAEFNHRAEAMIERLDKPHIRFFRTSELVAQHADGDMEVATPDGFHYTPRMHRIIGGELAREIMKWAETQEHLRLPE